MQTNKLKLKKENCNLIKIQTNKLKQNKNLENTQQTIN